MFGTVIDIAMEDSDSDIQEKRKTISYQKNLDSISLTNSLLRAMCSNDEGVDMLFTDLLLGLNKLLTGGNELIQRKAYMYFLMQPKSELMFENMSSMLVDLTRKVFTISKKATGQLSSYFDLVTTFKR